MSSKRSVDDKKCPSEPRDSGQKTAFLSPGKCPSPTPSRDVLPWLRTVKDTPPVFIGKGRGTARGTAGGQDSPETLVSLQTGVSIDTRWEDSSGCRGRATPSRPLEIELPYPSRSGNRHQRHGRGSHYLSTEAKAYIQAVRKQAELIGVADIKPAGPFVVDLVLQPPDGRDRDGDNVEKVVMDALVKAGVFADDSNKVIRKVVREWVDPAWPGHVLVIARRL